MRKSIALGGAAAVAAASLLSGGAAFATQPGTYTGPGTQYVEDGGHKITFCHRTGSATNPYVVITTDIAAVNGSRGSDHSSHGQVGNGPIGDVIPPIAGVNSGDGLGKGLNWDDNWVPGTTKAEIAQGDLCGAPTDYPYYG
jgi:hypothetical protein